MVVLGLDTSCYTTSAAFSGEDGEILGFERKLLPVAEGNRGLRQSDALFIHTKQLPEVMEKLMAGFNRERFRIAAVCASSAPCGAENSYMPVFTAGLAQGRTISALLGIPMYTTNHQQGHIEAGLIGSPYPEEPFCALHLSGGTTDLLFCRAGNIEKLGSSLDLHAGQLLDRIGVKLGFSFPAGAELERLALGFSGEIKGRIPVSMEKDGLCCHMSGGENGALRMLEEGISPQETAAELFDFIARTIARMTRAAYEKTGASTLLVVGGVSSSQLLRDLLKKRLQKMQLPIKLLFGEKCYSTDNAAGVARIGMKAWKNSGCPLSPICPNEF